MEYNKKCIVLTGGGTAGHVMVHINLEKKLKQHFDEIIYIGSKNGIEKELITKQTSYKFIAISTVKFDRKNKLKNLLIPFKLNKAINEAKQILKKYKPSIVFSKGGYVGLPTTIAANQLKIPSICHESDITMGLANKFAKHFSTCICTSFKKTAVDNGKKCIYTSMPLNISKLSKEEAKNKLKINTSLPVLLITGGSLGAKYLNEFIFSHINELSKKYYILHLVGKNNLNKNLNNIQNYKQIEFSNDMWTIFKATDFAISRAGANTIIELLSNNILTIFIPLPKGISRGDQIENAKYLENKNLAKTILQENLTITNLLNTLESLKLNKSSIITSIKKEEIIDGSDNIINILLKNKN